MPTGDTMKEYADTPLYLYHQKFFPLQIVFCGEVERLHILGSEEATLNGLLNGGQDLRHLEAAEVLVQSLQEVHLLLLNLPAPADPLKGFTHKTICICNNIKDFPRWVINNEKISECRKYFRKNMFFSSDNTKKLILLYKKKQKP